MSDWNISSDVSRYSAIGTIEYANSRGTTIRTGSPAHTKGGYALLTPSTPFDADSIGIHIGSGDTVCKTLIDIALAPQGGTPTVVIHNLMGEITTASFKQHPYVFPTSIPASSSILARVQSNSSVCSFTVAGFIAANSLASCSSPNLIKTYGISSSASSGTSLDPGGTANVKGSWVEITPSTSAPISQMLIGFCGQANDLRVNSDWLVDVGVGANGSEQVYISNIPIDCIGAGDVISPRVAGPFNVSIPTGSRIAMRSQCSITDATDRLFDVAIYGIS